MLGRATADTFAFGRTGGYRRASTMDAPSSRSGLAPILAGLALLVAGGHLAYALSRPVPAATTGPIAAADPGGAECRCDDASLRSDLADLRRTLRSLEQAVSARAAASHLPGGIAPGASVPASRVGEPVPPSEKELAAAVSGDTALPEIELFIGIPDGVTLSQRPDGTVSAKATRPERVGEEIFVHILTKGGEAKLLRTRAE